MEKFVMNVVLALVLVAVATETMTVANAQNCGPDGGGKTCPDGICCMHQTIIDQPRTNDRNSSSTSNSTHTDEDDSSYNDPHCGTQGKGLSCADGFCCSRFGYCGTSVLYCGEGCQDSCSGSTPAPY
ncbi:unnamed protein product [Linum perenne]